MKAWVLPYLLPLCVWYLTGCDSTTSRSPPDAVTFDTAKRLDDFDFASSGDGGTGEWLVGDNDAGRALAQINTEPSENRLSFAIYRPFSGRDVYVSTSFMTISGKVDQSAGVFVRFRSADDYYAVRATRVRSMHALVSRHAQITTEKFAAVPLAQPSGPPLGTSARISRCALDEAGSHASFLQPVVSSSGHWLQRQIRVEVVVNWVSHDSSRID